MPDMTIKKQMEWAGFKEIFLTSSKPESVYFLHLYFELDKILPFNVLLQISGNQNEITTKTSEIEWNLISRLSGQSLKIKKGFFIRKAKLQMHKRKELVNLFRNSLLTSTFSALDIVECVKAPGYVKKQNWLVLKVSTWYCQHNTGD